LLSDPNYSGQPQNPFIRKAPTQQQLDQLGLEVQFNKVRFDSLDINKQFLNTIFFTTRGERISNETLITTVFKKKGQ